MREQLADKYFKGVGVGLEIGALHCPTPLPTGAMAHYVEHPNWEINHADMKDKAEKKPDLLDDAEHLESISDKSYSFLIANHVLEHCEDPIGTLKNWCRVVTSGGHLMVALPDKEQCFDRKRAVTPLAHIILDHEKSPAYSKLQHYIDWYQNSELEGLTGVELYKRVVEAFKANANVHWHVWTFDAMLEMFTYVAPGLFDIIEYKRHGAEVIWILKTA